MALQIKDHEALPFNPKLKQFCDRLVLQLGQLIDQKILLLSLDFDRKITF